MLRAYFGLLAAVVALVLLACGGSAAHPQAAQAQAQAAIAPHVETPCEKAGAQRARVPGLLAQGKLDRTLRVIAKANALCAAEARETWGEEVETLAEIGRYAEARALAETIAKSDAAGAETKSRASKALATVERRDVKLDASDE